MSVCTFKKVARWSALILFLILHAAPPVFSQDLTSVSGRVTDKSEKGSIPGVSVKIKGSSTGVSTDAEGRFSLRVPNGSTLVFSSIGFQTIELPAAANMQVALTGDERDLQEVTVVGVTIRKKDLTGSVAGVTAETIRELPVTNINQAIQGRIPGVLIQNSNPRPGNSASIKVRGNNSIQFGASPIYVVDGTVIDDGSFNSINPDDIASIDVLKDASATALYGSRGANGVVLVTTKRARNGEGRVE
jgi:TonB-dependent SusC/RagA subfamily outer membrane receptor